MFFIPASATGTALLETPFPHIRRTFATKNVKIKSQSIVFVFLFDLSEVRGKQNLLFQSDFLLYFSDSKHPP